MKRKFSLIVVIILLFSFALNIVYANGTNGEAVVVEKLTQTMDLPNNQGRITKTITDVDKENLIISVQLKLENLEQEMETTRYNDTEIFIIVPSRFDDASQVEYANIVEQLANNIFSKSEKVKIGLIEICGTTDAAVEGSMDDSRVILEPTRNTEDLLTAIANIETNLDYFANLESAIRLAGDSYSPNVNKILISLFSKAPGSAIGIENMVFANQETVEEKVIEKNQDIVDNTKAAILELNNKNIDLILIRPENTSFDQKWYSVETNELFLEFDGSAFVEELYGTVENPVYGKIYSLENSSLEEVVIGNMYEDVISLIPIDIRDLVIKDYFSEEILSDFELIYDATSSSGSIEEEINEQKIGIIWSLDRVLGGHTVVLDYKLKLLEEHNIPLDEIVIVGDRIEVSYTNVDDEDEEVTLLSDLAVDLSKPIVEEDPYPDPEPEEDDTKVPLDKIPNAGKIGFTIVLMSTLIGAATFGRKYFEYNKLV